MKKYLNFMQQTLMTIHDGFNNATFGGKKKKNFFEIFFAMKIPCNFKKS